MFQILPPDFPLSQEDYNEQENSTFQAYQSHQVDMAVLFGARKEQAELDMTEVLEFEIELFNVS